MFKYPTFSTVEIPLNFFRSFSIFKVNEFVKYSNEPRYSNGSSAQIVGTYLEQERHLGWGRLGEVAWGWASAGRLWVGNSIGCVVFFFWTHMSGWEKSQLRKFFTMKLFWRPGRGMGICKIKIFPSLRMPVSTRMIPIFKSRILILGFTCSWVRLGLHHKIYFHLPFLTLV